MCTVSRTTTMTAALIRVVSEPFASAKASYSHHWVDISGRNALVGSLGCERSSCGGFVYRFGRTICRVRLFFAPCAALPKVYFDSLIVWIFAVVDLPVVEMILIKIYAVMDPKLNVLVTDNILLQSLLLEVCKQRFELLRRHSLVYNDEDGHASRAKLEEDPRLILCSCVVVTTEALEIGLVGIESFVVEVHVARVELAVAFAPINSQFDIVVTEHALVAFDFEGPSEPHFELPLWYPVVYEDMDDHASLTEAEVDSAAVFCSCLVVAA